MEKIKSSGYSAGKSKGMPVPHKKGKNVFVHHSKHEVVSSPEGVKTWKDAMNKVMANYSQAWERLAKK